MMRFFDQVNRVTFAATVVFLSVGFSQAAENTGHVIFQTDFDSAATYTIQVLNKDSGIMKSAGYEGSTAYVGEASSQVKPGNLAYIYPIPFKAGRRYRISAMIRGEAEGLNAWLYYYPSTGKSVRFTTTTEWKLNSAEISFPPDAYETSVLKLKPDQGRIKLFTGHTNGKGKVYFDDIKIELLPPELGMVCKSLSVEQKVRVSVNTAGFDEFAKRDDMRLTVSLIAADTGETRATKQVVPTEKSSVIELSTAGLPEGNYLIRATVTADKGQQLAQVEEPFTIGTGQKSVSGPAWGSPESWKANRLGILAPGADAPKPWTNLSVDGNKVKCWGRTYTFGEFALPSGINVLDQDILTGPVKLNLVVGGKPATTQAPHVTSKSSQKVALESIGKIKGLSIQVETDVEFDGMMKYTITLTPESGPVTIDSLGLGIPLRRDVAQFVYPYDPDGKVEEAVLDPSHPWSRKEFNHQVWIGNDERGLAWFAEDEQGWNVKKKLHFQTRYNDDSMTLDVNMIDTPTKLSKPLKIVFGLQATPVKPRRADWKNFNFRTQQDVNIMSPEARPTFMKYHGFPLASDDTTEWEKMLTKTQYVLPRIFVQCIHDQHPFYRYYEDALEAPGTRFDMRPTNFKGYLVPVKGETPLWEDFFLRSFSEYVNRWKLKGMYNDVWFPRIDENGRMHLWAFRDFVKRIYIIGRQANPDFLIICHSSALIIPAGAFVDVTLQGEQVRTELIKDGFYLSVMDIGRFRVENYIVDFGTQPMVLPQFRMAWGKDPDRSLHIVGLCMLHDTPMWVSWMNREPFWKLDPIWRPWHQNGTFHPYWKSKNEGFRVSSSNKDILVSYYERPEGLLLVVMNTVDEMSDGLLKLDTKGLDLGDDYKVIVHDFFADAPIIYSAKTIQADGGIPVEIKNYAALLVEVKK